MKNILTFIILTLGSICFSQTQAKMNQAVYAKFNKSDKQLNETYQTVLSEYKTDSTFIENLKKSQRIWVQFRDAEMKMKYPEYSDKTYGTVQPTCRAFYLNKLTDERIETLKTWGSGIEEGDVCSGSVKITENNNPDYGLENSNVYSSEIIRNFLYKGTLNGTIKIRLYLNEQEHPCGGNRTILNAMYKYDNQEKWLLLDATADKEKKKYCMVEDNFTGVLFLEENGNLLNGNWISPDAKKQFKIELEKVDLDKTTIEKLDEILFDDLLYNKSDC